MKRRDGLVWMVLFAGAVALPLAAFASHGKVGLWEVTNRVDMSGMMANVPPEAMARMKAMGMDPSGTRTYTTQQCWTAEQVAQDNPPMPRKNEGCGFTNMTHGGGNFTADLVCNTPNAQGRGHVAVSFDSNEHFSGTYAFSGAMQGRPENISSSFEGRWISADCGSVK